MSAQPLFVVKCGLSAINIMKRWMAMSKKDIEDHPFILTVERMLWASRQMALNEAQALSDWESVNLGDGSKGTSDWPGWKNVLERIEH